MLQPVERLKEYIDCARDLGGNAKETCSIFWRETKNLRVRLGLGEYHPNEIYSLKTIYGPLHFRDNFGDITNLPGLFHQNVYRAKALVGDGVILDVGANIGLAAAWFAYYNPEKTIYCFEPLSANASLIGMNCPSAKVNQVAVGAKRGHVKLNVDPQCVMASRIPCRWETTKVEFDVISLDEFVEANSIEDVALLKIDVEGMEVDVLKGFQKNSELTHLIAMETHGRSCHDDALGLLTQSGFAIDAEVFEDCTGLVFASSQKFH
jgi:FkbM family methyltransferase